MAAINWASYTEAPVGRGHPTLPDVINRPLRQLLAASGYDPDADVGTGFVRPATTLAGYSISDAYTKLLGDARYGVVVATSAARDSAYPAPSTDQRVYNKETGDIERYTGSAWVADVRGVDPVLGSETGVINRRYAYTDPRRYGAVGDGVTNDTVALQNAITSAGQNGSLIFPRSKVYMIDNVLTFLTGQTIRLNGSTLKRMREKVDTTTTPILAGAGQQSIVVTNPGQWRIGQGVTVQNIPGGRTSDQIIAGLGCELLGHTILNIVGNTLTLSGSFLTAFPSGGTVTSAHELVYGQGTNITIEEGILDGNYSQNSTAQGRWEIHAALYLDGAYNTVRYITAINSQADSFTMAGDGLRYEHLRILDSQGNGTHVGGTNNWQADHIWVKNANLGGVAIGHADGGFILSNTCGKGQCSNLYVENAIAVIGSIDTDDDSEVTFTNVVGRNCQSALEMTTVGTKAGIVQLVGFRFTDCGNILLNDTQLASRLDGPYQVKLAHGHLIRTGITGQYAKHITVDDCLFDFTGDTTTTVATFNNSENVTITDSTTFIGGNVAVVIAALCQNVMVKGTYKDQYSIGVSLSGLTTGSKNCVVNGARFANSTSSSATYSAITLANGTRASWNHIDAAKGLYAIQMPNGGTGVTGAVADNNTIRTVAGMFAGVLFGGSLNNYWLRNGYTTALANAAPVANNIVDSNYILDATAAIDSVSIPATYRYQLDGWIATIAASMNNAPMTDTVSPPGRVMARAGFVTKFGAALLNPETVTNCAVEVWKSTDGGATWAPMTGLAGNGTGWAAFGTSGNGARVVNQGVAAGNGAFNAGDLLKMYVQTTSSILPIGNTLAGWIEVLN